MNSPDKIYIQIFCKENIWTDHKVVDEENVEYIRKDALLEWFKLKRFDLTDKPDANVYQIVIDKLNEM